MRTTISAAVCLALASVAIADNADAAIRKHTSISAQSLEPALREFAKERDLQLIFVAEDLHGRNTKGAVGELTHTEALNEILSGTGLMFIEIDEQTISILPKTMALDEMPRDVGSAAPPAIQASGAIRQTSETTTAGWFKRVRLAGADEAPVAAADAAEQSGKLALQGKRLELEEVVVTGSNIRGAATIAPVQIYDSEDIARTGYSTVQEFLNNLPQNSAGGPGGMTEDGSISYGGEFGNTGRISAVNLRGLGSVATLTLINGHRVVPVSRGAGVDVSLIPVSAIERVEVLTDGASAIYGADAVAGVVNIILRREYEGAESRVRFGESSRGDAEEYVAGHTFGLSWDGGSGLFALDYAKREGLSASAREVSRDVPLPYTLRPPSERYSALASVRTAVNDGLDLYFDVLASREDSQPKAQRFGRAQVFDWSARQANIVVGGTQDLGRDWQVDLSGGYSVSDIPSEMLEYLGLGTGSAPSTEDSSIVTADLKADGPLWALPGGLMRLAVGAAYRGEDFEETFAIPEIGYSSKDTTDRTVRSAFAELSVPLVSQANARAGVAGLQLSAAVRHDDYSDFGSTTNPKVALMWSPTRSFDVRTSYSTSFRAPEAMHRLFGTESTLLANSDRYLAPDGNGTVGTLMITGYADIGPEKSENWSAGIVLHPEGSSFSASLDYYDIKYTDRIGGLPFDLAFLQKPEIYSALITELTPEVAGAMIQEALARGGFYDGDTGSQTSFAGDPANLRYLLDSRTRNLSVSHVRGLDLNVNHVFGVRDGSIAVSLNTSYMLDYITALTERSRRFEQVDTLGYPIDLRIRASVSWSSGGLSLTAATSYMDSYRDARIPQEPSVDSYTVVDLTAQYDCSARFPSGLGRGLKLTAAVQNLFDKDPPAITRLPDFPVGFDASNASAIGRFISLGLSKSW